jgi:hypothetical protein
MIPSSDNSPESPPAEPGKDDTGAKATPADDHPESPPEKEIGGPAGPEPTRYGDWERNGRCSDF